MFKMNNMAVAFRLCHIINWNKNTILAGIVDPVFENTIEIQLHKTIMEIGTLYVSHRKIIWWKL
ncbi:hypothetical protein CN585_30050 [Bacillus toyonensis]|uniref:Uncharacterized protein n=1 Tax=Bacillus toyonensis TaxID=155322 RepID=A0A2A8H3J9_9BACI|nr:hypothetical protein CN585_30050 [Bacillus toyonensis]